MMSWHPLAEIIPGEGINCLPSDNTPAAEEIIGLVLKVASGRCILASTTFQPFFHSYSEFILSGNSSLG